ncbi:dTDP-4-dehydrorhamnose reductase [Thalassospira marina]|uniref:dTDP-4-dehydrorhamnose reductase n=2 Tax=Thalassospira marina TaxID=2048283 RepID=A0ABN5FFB4_9PROT|nr:dTDP-4-dehydrorhamnose reductase [Thalassospira marina]
MICARPCCCWPFWLAWSVVCPLAQSFGKAAVMTTDPLNAIYDLPVRKYVLLLGAGGQLGQECAAQLAKQGISLFAPPRHDLDLVELSPLLHAIKAHPPAVLVNAAAFTDVDGAETLRLEARQINADVPGLLAEVAADMGVRLIHVSTDFVFSGEGSTPYFESDKTGPVNWYGATKRAGERAVRMSAPETVILRTAWLHGRHRRCFVHAMADKLARGEQISAVNDRFGSPTSAAMLASHITRLCNRIVEGDAIEAGIFHCAGIGAASPYDMATEIADHLGVDRDLVSPVSAAQRGEIAARPHFAVLDCSKIARHLRLPCQPWQEGIRQTLTQSGIPEGKIA